MATEIDLRSPAHSNDPYPNLRWLRENDPVHWNEGLRAWVVTRYDDVVEIFNQPARFSSDRFRRLGAKYASERPAVKAVGEVLCEWLVFRDPPDHTRLRGLLQRAFTPRHLARNRDGIQITIDSLFDHGEERDEIDFIRDFAFPLPAVVIAILLGAPTADIEPIKHWSDELAAYLGGSIGPADNFTRAESGLLSLVDYFRDLIREKARRPDENLISLMLAAEEAGDTLSEDEVIANSVLLLFAGHETTTNLLGNGLYHLLRNPAQLQRLRDDRNGVPSAVEEFLRFDGPVPATIKIVADDITFRGRALQRGQMLLTMLAGANRDPARFEEPEELNVRRGPNRHLAFGYGIHFCLGAPLARLEAQLAFDTLLARYPKIELCDPVAEWKPLMFFRALERLPLRLGA